MVGSKLDTGFGVGPSKKRHFWFGSHRTLERNSLRSCKVLGTCLMRVEGGQEPARGKAGQGLQRAAAGGAGVALLILNPEL